MGNPKAIAQLIWYAFWMAYYSQIIFRVLHPRVWFFDKKRLQNMIEECKGKHDFLGGRL